MGGELVVFGLEWLAARYGLDPMADVVTARARRMLDGALRKARGRSLNYDERTVVKSLQEVASSDSEILSDYLAGVIAGSGEEDHGVSTVAQIGRLSSLQLRLHYVIYRALWQIEKAATTGCDLRSHSEVASNLELFLSLEDLHLALPIDANGEGVRSILMALHVLAREDLIGAHTSAGRPISGRRLSPTTFKSLGGSRNFARSTFPSLLSSAGRRLQASSYSCADAVARNTTPHSFGPSTLSLSNWRSPR